jgi:hypothetical protein
LKVKQSAEKQGFDGFAPILDAVAEVEGDLTKSLCYWYWCDELKISPI